MITRLSGPQRATLGERCRSAREIAGLFQTQVGEATGYSKRSVINWEKGYPPADPQVRAQLADLYGVPEEVLFAEVHAYWDGVAKRVGLAG